MSNQDNRPNSNTQKGNQPTPEAKKAPLFPFVLDRIQLAERRSAWRNKKNASQVTMNVGSAVVRLNGSAIVFNADIAIRWASENDADPSVSVSFPWAKFGPLFQFEGKDAKATEQEYQEFQTACEAAFVDHITPLIEKKAIPPVDDLTAAVALIGTAKRGTSLKKRAN